MDMTAREEGKTSADDKARSAVGTERRRSFTVFISFPLVEFLQHMRLFIAGLK